MSQTQGVTVHPNRVFVKELPVDVDRQELMGAFSGFGWRIRTARVVNTNGSTNYGFLTFESKDEADAALDRAKSDLGILVRGKKVVVDHAFSRRTPPRRNSRQFSQAFQGLCRTRDTGVDVERDAQQHYIHQNYSCQYALSPSPDQRCASPASQMHYPMQSSQHYNNLCFDGRPVYLANPNQGLSAQTAPGIGQNGHFPFQHGGIHDDARSPPHWPVRTAHHYAYEEHPESRFGGVHPPYVTTHHPGLSGPLYVKNPAEGVEAPNMSDRFPHSESATLQRADHQMAAGFHHQSQEFNHQDQVQQLHHQTQLVHQHLAQQQSLFHGPWIQLMQYQHPQSPRRNSDCSSN